MEDWPPANYAAISANVAIAGIKGGEISSRLKTISSVWCSGHKKYGMFLRYGAPPTHAKWDYQAVVTASDSYVGDTLFSQDIRIEAPHPGSVSRTASHLVTGVHQAVTVSVCGSENVTIYQAK